MKENMRIEDEETLDLLSDPFTMDILNCLEEEYLTEEEICRLMDEKPSLIANYLSRMVETGLVEKKEDNFRIAARTIYAKDSVLSFNSNRASSWMAGFVNHMENNLSRQFFLLDQVKEQDRDLSKKLIGEFFIGHSLLYLNDEEIEEFQNMIREFIEDKKSSKRKAETERRKCHLYSFFFPEL